MTVRELKKLLENVPDNFEVRYEYDGPETTADIMAKGLLVSHSAKAVLFTENPNDSQA